MNTRTQKILFVLIAALAFSAAALGQSYNAGYAKYSRGDFKGAERSLLMAITKDAANESKAAILKLLGICQYMLGNKSGASKSFKDALGLDATLVISTSEVLDSAVVEYFNQVKKEVIKPRFAYKSSHTSAPAPSATVAQSVLANAPAVALPTGSATVAANSATLKEADPKTADAKKRGTYIIVHSDVPEANVMIDGILAGNTGTQIEVEPGMLMIEVNAPGHGPKFQKVTAVEGEVSNITVELTKPARPKKISQKKPKKTRKTARKKQKDEDDIFGENRGMSQRAGYDAAADFERDVLGGYPAPAPQPGYTPGYGYGRPYEQPYAAPPVALNSGGFDGRYENRSATNNNYFIAVLPFGAGQFQNRNVAGGLLFFAAEAGSIAFYLIQDKEAKTTKEELAIFRQQKEADEEELTEEDETYIRETEDYIVKTRQKSKYGLYGFGALWVVGAIEAILNDPVAKAAKQGQRYSRPGYGLEKPSRHLLPSEERYYRTEWQVRLIPAPEVPGSPDDRNSLKLQWDLKF